MSTVQEIEAAIQVLPRDEFSKLWQWWDHYREAAWDRQIEADLAAGKLLAEAVRDFEAGRCKPLP